MPRIRSWLALLATASVQHAAVAQDLWTPQLAVRDVALGEVRDGKPIQLEAYVRYSGELMLFDSERAEELGLVYPYCISSNSPSLTQAEMRSYDHKRVRVRGTVLSYEQPKDGPNTIQMLATVDGMVFANWCFGHFVLKIDSIALIKTALRE